MKAPERKKMPFTSDKPYQYNYDRKLRAHHWHQSKFLWLAKFLVEKQFSSVEYHGAENIPEKGAFLLCANHVNALDPINMVYGFQSVREMWFMAKREYFQMFYGRWFLMFNNGFPVDRSRADLSSIRFALRILRDGRFGLAVFPQGTRDLERRHPRELEAHPGAAMLARETKAPVVPVSIHLDPDLENHHPACVVRFGKPIRYEEFGFTEGHRYRRELDVATDLIMDRISELWEQDTL